jgi:ribonuclease HI
MKKIDIYTDGACKGNPGRGGYGAILVFNGHIKEISDGFLYTTNNRMELLGAIESLKLLKEPCEVTLTTDSQYLVFAITKGWVKSWQSRGWKKADKKPVLNVDLWQRLTSAMEPHKVDFVWIKGHNGHTYNERCDTLAVNAAENAKKNDEGYNAEEDI